MEVAVSSGGSTITPMFHLDQSILSKSALYTIALLGISAANVSSSHVLDATQRWILSSEAGWLAYTSKPLVAATAQTSALPRANSHLRRHRPKNKSGGRAPNRNSGDK